MCEIRSLIMKLAKTVGPSTKVNFGAFVIQIDTLELGKNGREFTEILICWFFLCSETSEKLVNQLFIMW